VKLRALFPNPEGILLPGLYVRAIVTEGVDPHGILVPLSAIGHDAKGDPYVLTVDAQNFARLTPVKTGRAIDSQWQVLSGLKPGDKVIVEGLAKVQPDMKVAPQPVAVKK
jgi:membrane fusion protein (multidrug efflux system)